MMVNCPKCGFSQPQDQYCAQCGIDMLAFKPAEKPLLSRVLGSLVFQILALVAVVAVVFGVIREQRRHDRAAQLAERIAEIENAKNTEIVSRRTADSAKNELTLSSTTPAPDNSQAAGGAPPINGSVSSASAPPPTTAVALAGGLNPSPSPTPGASPDATARAADGSAAAGKPAGNLRVVFAEVQRSFIADLVVSSDARFPLSSTGPILYGVIPNLQAKLRSGQGDGRLKIVDSNSRSIDQGQPASLNSGQRDEASGQMLGFDVEVVAPSLTDAESHLQLRVLRYLRDVNGQAEEFSVPLPDQMTIPKGAGAFISGVLPRRIPEPDRRFYDPFKVLHILSTEDYRGGATDLVILIEPR